MPHSEIISFGIVTVDDTYVVDGFPAPDTKHHYLSSHRFGGGQSATALVAASRLGCSCRWCGCLGDNELSDFIRQVWEEAGIAYDRIYDRPDAYPSHSLIINDAATGSRTIMWNETKVVRLALGERELALIDDADCLFVDQCMPDVQVVAARRAAAADKPIVSDIENIGHELVRETASLSNHFIIPAAMAASMFGETDPDRVLAKAIRFGRKSLVCMTDGERGSWFATADRPETVCHQPAFKVEPVVDTNGCGDVFHGAYAASLVKGFPAAERIRRAAAAAALKVRKRGGQAGAPDTAGLDAFLASQTS